MLELRDQVYMAILFTPRLLPHCDYQYPPFLDDRYICIVCSDNHASDGPLDPTAVVAKRKMKSTASFNGRCFNEKSTPKKDIASCMEIPEGIVLVLCMIFLESLHSLWSVDQAYLQIIRKHPLGASHHSLYIFSLVHLQSHHFVCV